jgi:HEAT repeat protein
MGLPAPVALETLSAVTLHPAPPDVAHLKRYAMHRNPNVRGAAVGSLAVYPDPSAASTVIAALHDPAGIVRGAASAAAGRAKLKGAIEPMLILLERGEESAARGLAAMADVDLAAKIADRLGKVPDQTLALCLGLILKRPDFGSDAAKVEVVRAIGKIQDKVAITVLAEYVDGTPPKPPKPSRQEAEAIVNARLQGGGK